MVERGENTHFEQLPYASNDAGLAYLQTIKSGSRVAVVGLSESIFIDPVGLEVAWATQTGSGGWYAIDPKSDGFLGSVYHPILEKRVPGAGNVDKYFRELTALTDIGVPLKPPYQYTKAASMLNFCLPKGGRVDLICDHDTSPFIVMTGATEYRSSAQLEDEFRAIYGYYYRQLSEGGYLILQTNNRIRNIETGNRKGALSLMRILGESGFNHVEYRSVNDRFIIPLPRQKWGKINNIFANSSAHNGYSAQKNLFVAEERGYLQIAVTGSGSCIHKPSPDMYIAWK